MDLLGIEGSAGILLTLTAVGLAGIVDGSTQGAAYAEAVDLDRKFTQVAVVSGVSGNACFPLVG